MIRKSALRERGLKLYELNIIDEKEITLIVNKVISFFTCKKIFYL